MKVTIQESAKVPESEMDMDFERNNNSDLDDLDSDESREKVQPIIPKNEDESIGQPSDSDESEDEKSVKSQESVKR